jgi:hypothetical protein
MKEKLEYISHHISHHSWLIAIIAFIVCIFFVGTLFINGEDAQSGDVFTFEDFEYTIISESDMTVEITDYNGSKTDLIIPVRAVNKVMEYRVIAIGNNAFYGCNAFNGMLTIGTGVTSIGTGAFSYCNHLTGSLVIPDSVTSIGNGAFLNCTGLTGTLTVGTGVTSIDQNAFNNIPNLDSMTILATTPPTLGNATNSLGSTAYTYPIYVPTASVDTYKNAYTNYASRIEAIP